MIGQQQKTGEDMTKTKTTEYEKLGEAIRERIENCDKIADRKTKTLYCFANYKTVEKKY